MAKEASAPSSFETVSEFQVWCSRAPAGTQLQASEVAQILATCAPAAPPQHESATGPPPHATPASWRERLWTVPAETRLGVVEVAEALDRPETYVYARTSSKARDRLPHRRLGGRLVFRAGELRTWIRNQEEEIVGLPMESTPGERHLQLEGAA